MHVSLPDTAPRELHCCDSAVNLCLCQLAADEESDQAGYAGRSLVDHHGGRMTGRDSLNPASQHVAEAARKDRVATLYGNSEEVQDVSE